MRRASGVGVIGEEEERLAEGFGGLLAFRAEEDTDRPESRTRARPEEPVLGGELGAALARTEEDDATARRVRTAGVVATAADVVALDVWRKLCREGGESGDWLLSGL